MQTKSLTFKQHYLIKINRGEEVLTALTKFCQANQIFSGSLTGIGAAGEIDLAHYSVETKQYSKQTFAGEKSIGRLPDDETGLELLAL